MSIIGITGKQSSRPILENLDISTLLKLSLMRLSSLWNSHPHKLLRHCLDPLENDRRSPPYDYTMSTFWKDWGL
jgi:hypothetical protein